MSATETIKTEDEAKRVPDEKNVQERRLVEIANRFSLRRGLETAREIRNRSEDNKKSERASVNDR